MRKFPEIGKRVTFCTSRGIDGKFATFIVADVDEETGCIYLNADDDAQARLALTHKVKNKHGDEIDVLAFAWIPQIDQFAANVEWDAWRLNVVFWEEFFARLLSDSDDL